MRRLDYVILALIPIVSAYTALTFQTNYLVTTLLFFGVGPLWFSFRAPQLILKTLIFTVLIAAPLGFAILDYILVLDGAWWSPTIFSSRFMGILPYEDLIWGLLQGYFVIFLYEYFLDVGKNSIVGRNFKYFFLLLTLLASVFTVAYYFVPKLLHISYAYFWIGTIFFISPSALFLWRHPAVIGKFVKLSCYFFYLHVIFEFTALTLGNWVFQGEHYISVVKLLGYNIPIEEIIVWWVLFIIAILSWYEFFDDDQK